MVVRSNIPTLLRFCQKNAIMLTRHPDCGTAMQHIEAAALGSYVKGGEELLKVPQVAKFTAWTMRG
jgi:hypothetical protein